MRVRGNYVCMHLLEIIRVHASTLPRLINYVPHAYELLRGIIAFEWVGACFVWRIYICDVAEIAFSPFGMLLGVRAK